MGNYQVLPKSSTNPGTPPAFSHLRGHSSCAQSHYIHKTSSGNTSQVPEAVKLSCQQGSLTWVQYHTDKALMLQNPTLVWLPSLQKSPQYAPGRGQT